jgi:hypothetical protein
MNRVRLISVIVGLAVVLGGPAAAIGAPSGNAFGHTIRFDVVQFVQGTVFTGGTALSRDATTGDTVLLTASGQAKPGKGDAAGGGTFEHRHSNGVLVARGVWIANSAASWNHVDGTLVGAGLADGIGVIDDTAAGNLVLNVTLMPEAGGSPSAVLTVHCTLVGSPPTQQEGVTLDVGSLHFTPVHEEGFTVFHVLN